MMSSRRWASTASAASATRARCTTTSRACSRRMPSTLASNTIMSLSRYSAYIASLLLTAVSGWFALHNPEWRWAFAIFALLAIVGTVGLLQRKSTLRRNYPLLAHFRYGLESIGPEMRQYFIEADTDEVPFSRQQRALVYQRSKSVMDVVPFGTEHDVYDVAYEWINHSIAPSFIESHDFRIRVGVQASQPYDASVFNISAMSF